MANLIFKKNNGEEKYQNFLIENGALFTQSNFYGDWHKFLGRKIHSFSVEDSNDQILLYAQGIELEAPFGKNILYFPYGPFYKKQNFDEVCQVFKNNLKKFLKENKTIFARLDFDPLLEENLNNEFKIPNKKTWKGSIFQPRNEWVLDLILDEENIYKNINKKNRYCIRQANDRGVKVEIINENIMDYFNDFYKLLETTSKRNNFSIHKKEYYLEVFKTIDKYQNGYVVISKFEDQICDILVFLNYGDITNFIFGGSDDKYREIPTAHLAQWHSIKFAKSFGMKKYNFGGISSDDYKLPELESVTRFKKRFGGEIFKHSDFFDLVSDKFLYWIYVLRKMIKGV